MLLLPSPKLLGASRLYEIYSFKGFHYMDPQSANNLQKYYLALIVAVRTERSGMHGKV